MRRVLNFVVPFAKMLQNVEQLDNFCAKIVARTPPFSGTVVFVYWAISAPQT